jgi:hypothetical protein
MENVSLKKQIWRLMRFILARRSKPFGRTWKGSFYRDKLLTAVFCSVIFQITDELAACQSVSAAKNQQQRLPPVARICLIYPIVRNCLELPPEKRKAIKPFIYRCFMASKVVPASGIEPLNGVFPPLPMIASFSAFISYTVTAIRSGYKHIMRIRGKSQEEILVRVCAAGQVCAGLVRNHNRAESCALVVRRFPWCCPSNPKCRLAVLDIGGKSWEAYLLPP